MEVWHTFLSKSTCSAFISSNEGAAPHVDMATCGGYCHEMLSSMVPNPNFNSHGLTVGGYGGGRGVGPGGLLPGGVAPGGLGVGIGM